MGFWKKWFVKGEDRPYLDKIDVLEHMQIVRLKGCIDQTMIPIIERRINYNRQRGDGIDKNLLLDFSKVTKVDSASIAFHIIRIKEFQEKNKRIGFINVAPQWREMLTMFHKSDEFCFFNSEKEAVESLNVG